MRRLLRDHLEGQCRKYWFFRVFISSIFSSIFFKLQPKSPSLQSNAFWSNHRWSLFCLHHITFQNTRKNKRTDIQKDSRSLINIRKHKANRARRECVWVFSSSKHRRSSQRLCFRERLPIKIKSLIKVAVVVSKACLGWFFGAVNLSKHAEVSLETWGTWPNLLRNVWLKSSLRWKRHLVWFLTSGNFHNFSGTRARWEGKCSTLCGRWWQDLDLWLKPFSIYFQLGFSYFVAKNLKQAEKLTKLSCHFNDSAYRCLSLSFHLFDVFLLPQSSKFSAPNFQPHAPDYAGENC